MAAARYIAVVVATIALAGLTGCGSSSHPASSASHSPPSSETGAPLTVARADTVFGAFLPRFNQLPSEPALAARVTTGPLAAAEAFLKGHAGPTVGTLSGEHFLVPSLAGYPRWFLATGTASDGQGFLFVMVQQAAGAAWRASAELFDLSAKAFLLPTLKLAGFGSSQQANAVQADDASLEIAPAELADAYARAEDHAGAANREFAAGPYTNERLSSNQEIARQALALGWKQTDLMSTANEPEYGLDLPSGEGALVLFFTKETYTWAAGSGAVLTRGGLNNLSTPPASFLSRLGVTSASSGLRITNTSIDQNHAFVGPLGTKTIIVANNGLAVSLSKN
jgi:hypothetical protein